MRLAGWRRAIGAVVLGLVSFVIAVSASAGDAPRALGVDSAPSESGAAPLDTTAGADIDTTAARSPMEARSSVVIGALEDPTIRKRIHWHRSLAIGTPWDGRLENGVRLPAEGRLFFTWNPVTRESPNRAYRRYGTDRLIRMLLGVLRAYAKAHPGAPRVGVGDISRRRGGDFGPRFGGLGHTSHQNGLDADVYYPRLDERESEPRRPTLIDRELAQDLVDRFVRAGAQFVFVGPNTGLTGPPEIVQALVHHDNHMHVRIGPKG